MKLSIIIPTYRRAKSLFDLLASLQNQNFSFEDAEVLIVANLHDEKLLKKIKQLQPFKYQLHYFYTNKKGANTARNLGLRKATGEIALFLDDDCKLNDTNYLTNVYNLHQEYPYAIGVGGYYRANNKNLSLAQKAYNYNAEVWLKNSITNAPYTSQLIGGNAAYKTKLLKDRLKFDENIKYGGTETEFNFRLTQEGHKLILNENITIDHYPQIDFFKLIKKAYLQGRGHRYLNEKTNLSSVEGNNTYTYTYPKHPHIIVQFYLNVYLLMFNIGFEQYRNLKKDSYIFNFIYPFKSLTSKAINETISFGKIPFHFLYHFFRLHYWRVPHFFQKKIINNIMKIPNFIIKTYKLHYWKLPHYIKNTINLHIWKIPHFFINKFIIPIENCYYFFKKYYWIIPHQIYYKIIFPLLFPFRKIYYFCSYQYNKRIKVKTTSKNVSANTQTPSPSAD